MHYRSFQRTSQNYESELLSDQIPSKSRRPSRAIDIPRERVRGIKRYAVQNAQGHGVLQGEYLVTAFQCHPVDS